MIDIDEILKLLPHRHPFLLIDRVIEIEPGKSLVAIKNVSINEPFFKGHFPDYPVMPGVLILESLAQACGVLAIKSLENYASEKSLFYFAGIDNARFRQVVKPGDQMRLEVELKRYKGDLAKFKGNAYVDNKLVCSAELTCVRRDKDSD